MNKLFMSDHFGPIGSGTLFEVQVHIFEFLYDIIIVSVSAI